MIMRHISRTIIAAFAVASVSAGTPLASPYGDNDDDEFHLTTPVRGVYFGNAGRNRAERAMQADLTFARNMSQHHQGAVDMATYYLTDPRGTNPILRRLAQGIIRNQNFEIAVLEVVRRDVERGPHSAPGNVVVLNRGWEGLEHEWYFVKAPAPSALDIWLSPNLKVSEFDVQFARPMIQHHSMAIEMAKQYNNNPDGGNSVIGTMNYEIMIDQRAEISLLERMIARHGGGVAAVPDDPRMMDIMHRSMPAMASSGGQPVGGMGH